MRSIIHDSTYQKSQTTTDFNKQIKWNHTCSGSDRLLIIGVLSHSSYPTGITYGGNALTLARRGTDGARTKLAMYYLVNPPSGSNQVVVTFPGTNVVIGVSSSYNGVKQVSPLDTTALETGSNNSGNTTEITTAEANELLFIGMGIETAYNPSVSDNAGQTRRLSKTGSYSDGYASDKIAPSAGANSMGYTWSTSFGRAAGFVQIVLAFKEAVVVAAGRSQGHIFA